MTWLDDPCDHHRIDAAARALRKRRYAAADPALAALGISLDDDAKRWLRKRHSADDVLRMVLRVLVKAARRGTAAESIGVNWDDIDSLEVRADRLEDGGLLFAETAKDGSAQRRVGEARSAVDRGERARELLEAVVGDPADEAPRRVLADWLSERGDDMGEMVAISCSLQNGHACGMERLRLAKRAAALAKSLPSRPWPLLVESGLQETSEREADVCVHDQSDVRGVVERFRYQPCRAVFIKAVDLKVPDAALLRDWLATVAVERLTIQVVEHSGNTVGADDGVVRTLLSGVSLPRLAMLDVDVIEELPEDLPARAPRLRHLEIGCPDTAVDVVARAEYVGFLRVPGSFEQLGVGLPLEAQAAQILGDSTWPISDLDIVLEPQSAAVLQDTALLRGLDRLSVGWMENAPGLAFERFLRAIQPPRRLALRVVDHFFYYDTEPEPLLATELLLALASAAPWPGDASGEHELTLKGIPFQELTIEGFAKAPRRPRPTRVRLEACDLGPAEIARLAEIGLFAHAVAIDLSSNAIGDEGAKVLLHAWEARELCLQSNGIGAGIAGTLLESGLADGLRTLDLSENRFRDEGAIELARIDMPQLRSLDLRGCHVGKAGAAAIEKASWFGQLTQDPLGRDAFPPPPKR